MKWMLAAPAMLWALAGCGGDFCSADVSTLAGTWEVSFSSGGSNTDSATVAIDADGNVTVTSSDSNNGWSCELLQDQLCDLRVHCAEVGGSDEFTFSLSKK